MQLHRSLTLHIKKSCLGFFVCHCLRVGGVCDWIWTWAGWLHWSASGSKECTVTSLYTVRWV